MPRILCARRSHPNARPLTTSDVHFSAPTQVMFFTEYEIWGGSTTITPSDSTTDASADDSSDTTSGTKESKGRIARQANFGIKSAQLGTCNNEWRLLLNSVCGRTLPYDRQYSSSNEKPERLINRSIRSSPQPRPILNLFSFFPALLTFRRRSEYHPSVRDKTIIATTVQCVVPESLGIQCLRLQSRPSLPPMPPVRSFVSALLFNFEVVDKSFCLYDFGLENPAFQFQCYLTGSFGDTL